MINNIKSVMALSTFVVGTLLSVSSCDQNNKVMDTKESAEEKNEAKLISESKANDRTIVVVKNNNDADFLMNAAEMHLEQISLGKLAQQKGNSTHVKNLGKTMVDEHSKSLSELKMLAQSKSIAIPTSITDDSKETLQELTDITSGDEFGKSYSDMMVERHEEAIEIYETASTESEDSDIKTWASMQLQKLRGYLKQAVASKVETDKMKS